MGKEWTLAMEELTIEGCGTAVQAPKDEAIGEQEEGDSLPSSSRTSYAWRGEGDRMGCHRLQCW